MCSQQLVETIITRLGEFEINIFSFPPPALMYLSQAGNE